MKILLLIPWRGFMFAWCDDIFGGVRYVKKYSPKSFTWSHTMKGESLTDQS